MIIMPNSYVPQRRNGNIALWEVKETAGWISWNEINHTDAALRLHVITYNTCNSLAQ